MKKIVIVTDSSVSFTDAQIKQYDVYIVPNLIIHNEETYLDQETITNEDIYKLLENHETVTTSQPNIGTMIETFEEIIAKGYEHIIILTIASNLSGGFNAFHQAARQINLENYTIVDSHSIGGIAQQGVRAIRKLNEEGKSLEEILAFLDTLFKNQTSYLYPKTLDQIIASGRLSKTAGRIASFLKIKTVVYFGEKDQAIERLGVARTDNRIFDTIVKHFKENNVSPKTHDLYLLESRALEQVEKFKDYLYKELGEFKSYTVNLPAALCVHAGVGAITVQWCLKI
ncbi:MAG: DegV family protein [Erysipelothrix sp.]|nr:DegV family protein [Erysipelothrix sp.]